MLERLGKEAYDKLTFWVSGVILLFLTAYLFVFYISTIYSAVFRESTANDETTIFSSVFEPDAIRLALSKSEEGSVLALLFVLLFPVISLGLAFLVGWLAKKWLEKRGSIFQKKRVFILATLLGTLLVTLFLDVIIAYQIVDRVAFHRALIDTSNWGIEELLEPSESVTALGRVLSDINFWLILFLGFVVSLMLSLVYYAFAQENEKRYAVNYNIKIRQRKIAEYKDECKKYKDKLQELETQKNSIEARIKNRQYELNGIVILVSDIKEYIGEFFVGWVSYLNNAGKEEDVEECKTIKESFIDYLISNAFYTNVSN